MKIIGIVGGMGAGKSTVIALMQEMQTISYISADLIGHDILLKGQPAYEPIVKQFGKEILNESGEIVRKQLGQLVFGDAQKVNQLNEITHPLIVQRVKKEIQLAKERAPRCHIILEAALLLESGLDELTDCVIGVYADVETRIKRVIQREGLSREQIENRLKAQKAWDELKAASDYVIDNSISLENTKEQIQVILKQINEECPIFKEEIE